MILLTISEIIALQKKIIDRTGGLSGIRDQGLLESAVYSVFAGFEDMELYPTVEEKAARLAYAITSNHAFLDGNKRIGIYVMLVTLELNGIYLQFSQTELIRLGLGIADGSLPYEAVLQWLQAHK
ncbi:MAG: type II toxin-antitoxin system death-on-curing family toxin [Ruminiclostridium sp.]